MDHRHETTTADLGHDALSETALQALVGGAAACRPKLKIWREGDPIDEALDGV